MEDSNELHPTLDAKGVHVFDVEEVTRVVRERSRRAVDPTKEGERDARAFEMLDGGHDLRYLVTTLRISVNVAKQIVSAWIEAGQSDVVVPRACKVEIERCLGRFRDATELVQRARAVETSNERVNEELRQLETRQHNLVALIGRLAARNPALADVLPEVRESLDVEMAQVLDGAFEVGTTQLVSAAPRAPVPPNTAGESVAEEPNTGASPAADGEAAAGAAVGPAVPRAAASTDVVSASETSTTEVSVNDESALVGESGAAAQRGRESAGDPVSERRAVGRVAASSPDDVAPSTGATGGAASGVLVVRSPRELLLDAWLESLAADDARLQRLGALLTREEREMFAELARGIGAEVAATTGSRSRREQLMDALLVSLTEDEARLDQIGAMLTASELDMMARLGRGTPERVPSSARG